MYIELKTHPGGHDDRGLARIGRVTFDRTAHGKEFEGLGFEKVWNPMAENKR